MRSWSILIVVLAIGAFLPACRSALRLRAGEGFSVAESNAPLLAGASRVDLLPPWRLSLAGYGNRKGLPFEGVSDRPCVRALWLRSEGSSEGVAIVSADILIVPEELRRASLEKMGDSRPSLLLLAATHTHSGWGNFDPSPMSQLVATGGHRPAALEFLAQRIAWAVEQAREAETPVRLGVGVGEAMGLSEHRRDPTRAADPTLTVIRAMSGEKPVARIVSFAAHPTVLAPSNRMLSGDYPGFLCRELEKRWGGVVLFLNAACAEIEPLPPRGGRDLPAARRLGEALAQAAIALDAGIADEVRVPLSGRSVTVALPQRDSTNALFFPAGLIVSPFLRPQIPQECRLQSIRLGPATLASFPCDLGVELGRQLREGIRGPVIPVSYADGFIGYAIDEESYERGWYETRMSFYGPTLGSFLVEQARRMF